MLVHSDKTEKRLICCTKQSSIQAEWSTYRKTEEYTEGAADFSFFIWGGGISAASLENLRKGVPFSSIVLGVGHLS